MLDKTLRTKLNNYLATDITLKSERAYPTLQHACTIVTSASIELLNITR